MNTAIRFKHFIKTNKRHEVQDWLNSQLRGEYEFDSGGWRDYALLQERGVEFECEDDAKKFLLQFGGEFSLRKIRNTDGNTSVS